MIGILNYGLGNISAFANSYKRLGVSYRFLETRQDFNDITHIIMPGVGAFDYAMDRLNSSGMRDILEEFVLKKRVPILGICVGMQILGMGSDEGTEPGLGWLDFRVKKLNDTVEKCPLPHMGWNTIIKKHQHSILDNIEDRSSFYFLHSYFIDADNPHTIAMTEYSENICSFIGMGNILGIQCHPEKSHSAGMQLLKNFSGI